MAQKPFAAGSNAEMDATVIQSRTWASALLARLYRGPGDMEASIYRAEALFGVPASVFWALKYRPPKDITAAFYFRLKNAYEAEIEAQASRLRHEIEITKALGHAVDPALVDEASALLAEVEGKERCQE